jgi:outer membrane lipoprotein-sorting protein
VKKIFSLGTWVTRASLVTVCCVALSTGWASPGDTAAPAAAALTAEQIAERTVEVRGGLQAWQRISTIIWAGHLESQRSSLPSLPFRLEEKKPGKSRFEINEPSQRSLRVFNGASGWKLKMNQDGRPDVQPFSAQEVKFARSAPGLEGPLIDFRAKGITLGLEGTEELDGRMTYRMSIKLATGELQTVWVDAETFLEARYDRIAYSTSGAKGTVSLRLREYREVEGLALPSVIEISGVAGGTPDRMVIERVALNPEISDRDFEDIGAGRGRAANESRAVPR